MPEDPVTCAPRYRGHRGNTRFLAEVSARCGRGQKEGIDEMKRPDSKATFAILTLVVAAAAVGWQWRSAGAAARQRTAAMEMYGQPAPDSGRGAGPGGQWGQRGANGGTQQAGTAARGPGPGGGGGWQQMTPAERQARQQQRLDKMAKDLGLSDSQKTQVQALFEKMRQQRQAMRQQPGQPGAMTREQRMEERQRGRVEMRTAMQKILSADQLAKMDAQRQQDRQNWQNRGGGR